MQITRKKKVFTDNPVGKIGPHNVEKEDLGSDPFHRNFFKIPLDPFHRSNLYQLYKYITVFLY